MKNKEKTPNKKKRLKKKEEAEEETLTTSNAKTNNQTPNKKEETFKKSASELTPNSKEKEEEKEKVQKFDCEMEEEVKNVADSDKPRRSKRGRKPKNYQEEDRLEKEKKRDKKLKEKKEEEVVVPEEVQKAKASISGFQSELNNLIKAGIKSNSNFSKSIEQSFSINSKTLAEFVRKSDSIDLSEPETQIIFVKTLSCSIDGSPLPLDALIEECKERLSHVEEIEFNKISSLNFEEFLKKNCERKFYGLKPDTEDYANDTSEEALYCWEVVNVSLIDGVPAKDISMARTSRSLISDKIKNLSKIVRLLEKAKKTKDLERIEAEKDKLDKTIRKETAHTQKELQRFLQLKEKEEKEAEKLRKKREAELERDTKERQRKLETELKKEKELEEKERKKQESLKAKHKQELAKKKKEEELKKKREEAALLKKDEEERKKQEQLKILQEKENSQKKLMAFFKKKNSEVKENKKDDKEKVKTTTNLLSMIERQKQESPNKVEEIVMDFKDYCLKLKVQYQRECIEERMKRLDKQIQKEIFIEGSHKRHNGVWLKASKIISGRNPFLKDETVIDYDMDSEEEFEEENGEDISQDSRKEGSDDDEDMGEGEDDDFIVPDGYLSQSEKNDDDEEVGMEVDDENNARVKSYAQIKKEERKISTVMKPVISLINNQNCKEFDLFKIFAFKSYIEFPLIVNDRDLCEKSEEEEKKERMDPNAINNKIKELVLAVHGSYDTRTKIIDEFSEKHPE
jgi:hypothetical protein